MHSSLTFNKFWCAYLIFIPVVKIKFVQFDLDFKHEREEFLSGWTLFSLEVKSEE